MVRLRLRQLACLRRWLKLLLTRLRLVVLLLLLALMACLRLHLVRCHHLLCIQAVVALATRLASNGSLHPPCEARRLQLAVVLPVSRLPGPRLAM